MIFHALNPAAVMTGSTSLGLGSPFPGWLLAAWALAALLVLALSLGRLRHVVRPGYLALLLALRLLGLLAVLLLLLQPYIVRQLPDSRNFQVAVLADVSGSMKTQDCAGGRSRLEVVRGALAGTGARPPADAAKAALLARLTSQYRLRSFLFAEELTPYFGQDFDTRPGNTALGSVLGKCQDQAGTPPLGAVLLLSDGIANSGEAPEAVAKRFRGLGIPVSCIGVGEWREQGDVRVRFRTSLYAATKGQPVTLVADVENSFSQAVKATMELVVDGLPAAKQTLDLAPGTTQAWSQSYTPGRPGFLTAAVRLARVPGDLYPETDVDFAGIQVSEPPVFKLLYLGSHLNWEYKFLQLAASASSQLKLAAVVRSGPNSFHTVGLPGGSPAAKGFAGLEKSFNRYDGILLDLRALPLLSAEAQAALVTFVAARGGGLLAFGPPGALPEGLRKLLPVSRGAKRDIKGRVPLEISPSLVFDQDKSGLVHAAPDPVAAGPQELWPAAELKPGARPVLWFKDTPQPLLAAQAYGSGRVLYAGLESSWTWRLETDIGLNRHNAYWQNLLVWLASGSRPQISSPCNGRKFDAGGAVPLNVDVNTPGFEPAVDAQVSATVEDPAGKKVTLNLGADAAELGRFGEPFVPTEPGEYRVTFRADLTGGLLSAPATGTGNPPRPAGAATPAAAPGADLAAGLLQYEARFLVKAAGAETLDTAFREKVLRDVALITGGRYWSYRELDTVNSLPVSRHVPLKSERWNLCDFSACLFLFLAAFSLDWYARRRIGLK